MKVETIYAFVGGAVSHKTLGMLPTLVISGVILYGIEPTYFTSENLIQAKETIISIVKQIFG